MFLLLFTNLRRQGIKLGISEWLTFLRGLEGGLVTTLDELYGFGRSVLCTTEAQYDDFDIAFQASFDGVEIPEELSLEIQSWLKQGIEVDLQLMQPDVPIDKLWEELYKRMQEQKERHDGGSRWIGTGGRSPFGHSGHAAHGIRVGGGSKNRSAVSIAGDRQWEAYRTDTSLSIRDFQVALKALRRLNREGGRRSNRGRGDDGRMSNRRGDGGRMSNLGGDRRSLALRRRPDEDAGSGERCGRDEEDFG